MMIAHYTQAAMVAENRRLAAPASVDTIPTSAMQEDHVSMGWGAARKLRQAVANLARILAVELVCGARALDLRAPLTPAAGTGAARDVIRALVPGPGPDRWLTPDLTAVEDAVVDGSVLAAVTDAIGPLA
jgi:histidine ammonia-lyase